MAILYFMTSSGQRKKKQAHRMALNLKSILSYAKKKKGNAAMCRQSSFLGNFYFREFNHKQLFLFRYIMFA